MLYHLLPELVVGDKLLPLNRLAEAHPEAAARHRAKRQGREALLRRPVPPLGCLWNDVLHLSPVHPARVREALLAVGHRWPERGRPVAVVDPERVGMSGENTVLWLSPPGPRPLGEADPDDFAPFDLAALERHRAVAPQTWGHYRAFRERGPRGRSCSRASRMSSSAARSRSTPWTRSASRSPPRAGAARPGNRAPRSRPRARASRSGA